MVVCSEWFDGNVKQLRNIAYCEGDVACPKYVQALSAITGRCGGDACLKFAHMKPVMRHASFCRPLQHFGSCDLTVFTWPSDAYCVGARSRGEEDWNDPRMQSCAMQTNCLYWDQLIDVGWWECVASFRQSRSWAVVRAGMQAHGTGSHGVCEAMSDLHEDINLPTTNRRWYAFTKRGGLDEAELRGILSQELALERQACLRLEDCILGSHPPSAK